MIEPVTDFDQWRLCEELSIVEAALLVAGVSPSKFPDVENSKPQERPLGYEASKTAIRNALRSRSVKGVIEPEMDSDINSGLYPIDGTLSLSSRVEVASLKSWLASRGVRSGFFFPTKTGTPDFLDPANPRFALKLAAAVRAWQAVTDPGSKHPKQALRRWLRDHAIELKLTDEHGKINDTGIEEVAKVANWRTSGGAPQTPGGDA